MGPGDSGVFGKGERVVEYAGEWGNGNGIAGSAGECVMVDYEHGTFHEGFGRNGLDSEDRLALQELSQKLAAKGIRHILIADNIETIVYKAAIDPDFLIKGFGVLQGYADTFRKLAEEGGPIQ